MDNNDILRRIRYAFDFGNSTLLGIFAEAGVELSPAHLAALLKQEDEDGFEPLSDDLLGDFLDGFINQRRGKREGSAGEPPVARTMTNNRVLRSLKIALELKDVDIIDIMLLAEVQVSKGEVSALFRREGHPNYQPCGDQFMRTFFRGLSLRHRNNRVGA